ncbi:MAG TPA: methyltransferase domain-containing protein [Bauldia sp.]|nr:methyltransferase domain-containing protein [Bauldia sp.]
MTLPPYAMSQTSFPELYERYLVNSLFRPWAELTFEELKPSSTDRILDVACGTGIVARVARERLGEGASIVGVDISAEMLGVARRVAPSIDWREGNVTDLPLRDDERFDVVVCQQGLQFFPDKPAAAAQMRRALETGGTLAILTWRPDDEVPFFSDLRKVAERHLGPITDLRHSFGSDAPLRALLEAAGLKDVVISTVSKTIRFDDGVALLRLNTMALVGMSAAGKALSEDDRKRVIETIAKESAPILQRYTDGAKTAFDLSTNLATGRS